MRGAVYFVWEGLYIGALYFVGEPVASSFVMLEVHYNNPEKKAGVIDSSGIR